MFTLKLCRQKYPIMQIRVISYLVLLFFLGTLTSCTNCHLAVYTDYISSESLASYYIGTPDPRLCRPTLGQRLIVIWTLPRKYLCHEDLHLKLYVRFRNKQETVVNYPITKAKGTYVYSVLDDDYIHTDGILTWKVELIGSKVILDEWRHQIWTNLILVGNDKSSCEENSKQEEIGTVEHFKDFDDDDSIYNFNE